MLKIVMSGGPAAGKSSLIGRVRTRLESDSCEVRSLPEIPQLLIANGMSPVTNFASFEVVLFRLQIAWEEQAEQMFSKDTREKILLLDRGILDQLVYIDPKALFALTGEHGCTLKSQYDRYDAVIHLETCAGTEFFPNGASIRRRTFTESVCGDRTTTQLVSETRDIPVEECIRKEKATLSVNRLHPNFHFVGVKPTLKEKEDEVVQLILSIAQKEKEQEEKIC